METIDARNTYPTTQPLSTPASRLHRQNTPCPWIFVAAWASRKVESSQWVGTSDLGSTGEGTNRHPTKRVFSLRSICNCCTAPTGLHFPSLDAIAGTRR
ncbi:uncharacterized protein CCOS01_09348 [Colletotrichum costaricense]|uniref:Uncharacterized protein n=2 Tax=Colletotrichum acutatum species complex TaxID=2707335 RepID=A0AAI9YUL3_9PEZI|nr:uncharacterized protein CCOS01_09348 [Colletotrichum costaricense]KAK1524261.1 hypothetical protein CCOS01_09348 [Colletotrichum costaricense]